MQIFLKRVQALPLLRRVKSHTDFCNSLGLLAFHWLSFCLHLVWKFQSNNVNAMNRSRAIIYHFLEERGWHSWSLSLFLTTFLLFFPRIIFIPRSCPLIFPPFLDSTKQFFSQIIISFYKILTHFHKELLLNAKGFRALRIFLLKLLSWFRTI